MSELHMPPKTQDSTPEEQKAHDWADAIPDDAEQSDDYEPTYCDGSLKNECWTDSVWRDYR